MTIVVEADHQTAIQWTGPDPIVSLLDNGEGPIENPNGGPVIKEEQSMTGKRAMATEMSTTDRTVPVIEDKTAGAVVIEMAVKDSPTEGKTVDGEAAGESHGERESGSRRRAWKTPSRRHSGSPDGRVWCTTSCGR